MAHLYKAARQCTCGYTTMHRSNFRKHTINCKAIVSDKDVMLQNLQRELDEAKEQLAKKDEQLAAKDRQIEEKDRQIDELIKLAHKPRTTTTNNITQNVTLDLNIFGQESLEHIKPEHYQELIKDPPNAVSRYLKLMRRIKNNCNVKCPNKKQPMYQVLIENHDGEKEWEPREQEEVCENIYLDASSVLESEADEETRYGSKFLDFQDKIKASIEGEDNKREYNKQLQKIHYVITS